MAYTPKPPKPCIVCGTHFPPLRNIPTCSDECAAVRKQQRLAEWRAVTAEQQRARARQRRLKNLDRYRMRSREYQRDKRGTDPADYVENRDPVAIKERERERWRRGQAARRARMHEGAEHDGA